MQRWKAPVGWHAWVQPTNAQILARMTARRAERAEEKRLFHVFLAFSAAAGLFDRPARKARTS
ncbi:hypothetical protein [Streptomyces tremellae]|uniref:Transposase n=1 Tax=Streptomyces tremellae TaxID=1124239 RepID=A0ABP7EE92_9ACTN